MYIVKHSFYRHRTVTADVMKCWSREFDYESILGKEVFLSLYSSFCASLIPAVLGKVSENGIKSLHPFLSWVWSAGEESWFVKPFSKHRHSRSVAGSDWTSSQLPHPYNWNMKVTQELPPFWNLHMDSFAWVDFFFFTVYWRVGGQDFEEGTLVRRQKL